MGFEVISPEVDLLWGATPLEAAPQPFGSEQTALKRSAKLQTQCVRQSAFVLQRGETIGVCRGRIDRLPREFGDVPESFEVQYDSSSKRCVWPLFCIVGQPVWVPYKHKSLRKDRNESAT